MAVTETVKIVFDVDNKAITDTVSDLAALGKISQEDAAKFKQLSEASKVASKEIAAVGKSAESLKTVGDSVANAADGFVPLKTRLREAKEELQRLSDEFGEFSPQANAARARAGELADELSDLNRQVNLLNPESKIQAFSAFGQGVVGAFSIATGALQAFGAENEQVQAIATRLQGALNVVQGVQSIIQLKETYQDVKAVLGLTTVAQQTLTAATTTGTVATNGAAVATRGFAAALTSTGIGAIVVAIGALIGAYIAYTNEAEDVIDVNEALKKSKDDLKDSSDELTDSTLKILVAEGKISEQRAKIIQQREKESESVKPLIDKNKELAKSIADQKQEIQNLINAGAKVGEGAGGDLLKSLQDEVAKVEGIISTNEQSISNIREAGKKERKLLDIEETKDKQEQLDKQKEDAARNAKELSEAQNQALRQRIEDAKNAFEEERKAREDSVDLNRLMGATEEDILRQKQFNIQADIDGLQKVAELARGTEQYKQLLSQINDLKREQVKLDVQLANALQITEAPTGLEKLKEAIKKVDEAIGELQPIKVVVDPKTDTSFQDIIDKDDEIKEKRIEEANFALEQAKSVTDFIVEQSQRQADEKIARLEEEKEQGLITEETYEARVKQIKQKAAEDNKKAQVFQAVLSSTQAILTALTVQPATAVPAAVAFASVVGALNLAKILATPVPKFKDGTLSVPGKDHGRDSVHAMLRPGEAVIPTETNRMYAPTIEAIYRKRIKPSEINAFVLNRMSGKGSIGRDTQVKASVDTFALGKIMSQNKSVEVANARTVGKAIAGEILKAYNPRRA